MGLQHVVDKVECAEACSLRTEDTTSPLQALTRKGGSVELRGELLVHAKEITYLASTYTYITGRHVHIGANDLVELHHKCLAETHNLCIALTTGSKVGTSLATAHGQRGQCILECLFEAQEFQDGQVDRGVET